MGRKEVDVSCNIASNGFRGQGSGEFGKPLHTLIPRLCRGVEQRRLARAIEDVGHEHDITLSRQPPCHILVSRTNATDVSEMNDAWTAAAGFRAVERSLGRSVSGGNLDIFFDHWSLLIGMLYSGLVSL